MHTMTMTLEQRQARARRRLYLAAALIVAAGLVCELFPIQVGAFQEGFRAGFLHHQ